MHKLLGFLFLAGTFTIGCKAKSYVEKPRPVAAAAARDERGVTHEDDILGMQIALIAGLEAAIQPLDGTQNEARAEIDGHYEKRARLDAEWAVGDVMLTNTTDAPVYVRLSAPRSEAILETFLMFSHWEESGSKAGSPHSHFYRFENALKASGFRGIYQNNLVDSFDPDADFVIRLGAGAATTLNLMTAFTHEPKRVDLPDSAASWVYEDVFSCSLVPERSSRYVGYGEASLEVVGTAWDGFYEFTIEVSSDRSFPAGTTAREDVRSDFSWSVGQRPEAEFDVVLRGHFLKQF